MNRLSLLAILMLAWWCLLPASAQADSEIVIRLSCKTIINPSNGLPHPNFNQASLDATVADMNALMRSYGRGYRFESVGPLQTIGNFGGTERPDPSAYYSPIVMLSTLDVFADDVADFPTLYAWDPAAVNIFINAGNIDPSCNLRSVGLTVISGDVARSGQRTLHHLGHMFSLCNTQGCTCNCCNGGSGVCSTVPGDDGMADTAPDLPCWSRDQVAQYSYAAPYASLSAPLQSRVDDVFFNIMSHHNTSSCGQAIPADRLTEQQLDKWIDSASTTRAAACSGRTFFVDDNAVTFQNGRSTNPYDRVAEGVGAASAAGGDIVMVRGGSYPEPITISRPLTLRCPRGQTARIGQ